MDRNTLVAILGSVALAGLTAYGIVAAVMNIDSTITVVVTGALVGIATAVGTYLKTKGGE